MSNSSGAEVAIGGAMKLFNSGSTAVKATEGSIITPTAVTVTVSPGTATKLVLTSSTTTPVAAANFNLTTTAQDLYGNTATGYTGSKNITFSGASASPSGALPTVVNSAGTAINFRLALLGLTAGAGSVGSPCLFTCTITGLPLTIPATGSAVSATEFTYTAPASGAFTHTITAASSGYSNATATANK